MRLTVAGVMFAALLEEAGELARAFLEGAPAAQKRKEAVQVCAVAMRLFLDGDEGFSREVGPYDPTKEREES